MGAGRTYLLNNEMQVLGTAFDLIAHVRELDLRAGLEALLDRHFEDLVLRALLPSGRVVGLALDLHLLDRAVEQLFQRHGQRLLHDRNLRRLRPARLLRKPAGTRAFRVGSRSAAGEASRHGAAENVILVHAAHATTCRAVAEELGKDVFGVGEVERAAARPAAAGREAECPRTAATTAATPTAHAWAEGEAARSEGVSTLSAGEAFSTLGRRSAAS